MFKIGNIEILCGALADEAARETGQGGVFTRHLLSVLSQPNQPSLLTLPFDLDLWHQSLPANLLQENAIILGRREVLGERDEERHRPSQGQAAA
jgi:hypothetical protein